jgi:hypothetical protein
MPQFEKNETLRFLADVNVEKTIIDFLRQFGYLVQSVVEINTSMLDEDILNYAQRNNFIGYEVNQIVNILKMRLQYLVESFVINFPVKMN